MQWFAQAKLGIFIHWGIYAVNGVSESWSFFNKYLSYDDYMSQCKGFTAAKYNPKEWVDLIKESGARNTVIIMTSNAGTRQLKEFGRGIGFNAGQWGASLNESDKEYARSIIQKSLSKQFSPEFLAKKNEASAATEPKTEE